MCRQNKSLFISFLLGTVCENITQVATTSHHRLLSWEYMIHPWKRWHDLICKPTTVTLFLKRCNSKLPNLIYWVYGLALLIWDLTSTVCVLEEDCVLGMGQYFQRGHQKWFIVSPNTVACLTFLLCTQKCAVNSSSCVRSPVHLAMKFWECWEVSSNVSYIAKEPLKTPKLC